MGDVAAAAFRGFRGMALFPALRSASIFVTKRFVGNSSPRSQARMVSCSTPRAVASSLAVQSSSARRPLTSSGVIEREPNNFTQLTARPNDVPT